MESGRAGMGMKKYGKSGWKNGSGKSPKFRENLKRESEQSSVRPKRTTTDWNDSVTDAFKDK